MEKRPEKDGVFFLWEMRGQFSTRIEAHEFRKKDSGTSSGSARTRAARSGRALHKLPANSDAEFRIQKKTHIEYESNMSQGRSIRIYTNFTQKRGEKEHEGKSRERVPRKRRRPRNSGL